MILTHLQSLVVAAEDAVNAYDSRFGSLFSIELNGPIDTQIRGLMHALKIAEAGEQIAQTRAAIEQLTVDQSLYNLQFEKLALMQRAIDAAAKALADGNIKHATYVLAVFSTEGQIK